MDGFLRPSILGRTRGHLIEIEGELSSGRTALAYRIAAKATAHGELVGWVDLPDALDPRSLRRAGANLDGLLWVRPPRVPAALHAAELMLRTGFGVVVIDLEGAERELERGGVAIWSRLLRAVRRARATAVLLGSRRASGSFSTLGLLTERRHALFDRGLFEGLECATVIQRNRRGPVGTEFPLRVSHRPVPY